MNAEKRTFPRIPLDVKINSDKYGFATTKDISEGGICLIADQLFEKGAMMRLNFLLPDGGSEIVALGKVRWSRKASEHLYENGVSFWHIEDEDRKKLNSFLCGRL